MGTLQSERFARLEALGFVWRPFDAAWDEMYRRLATYKATHGDCNVSKSDDPQLTIWCQGSGARRGQGDSRPYRIAQLEKLGFDWEPHDAQWDETYGRLVAYKAAHGDCNVPATLFR